MADDSQIPVLVGAEDVSKTRQRREFKARLGFCLFLFAVLLIVSGEVWGAAVAGRLAGSSLSNRLASVKYGYGAGLVGALLGGASFAALALRSHVTLPSISCLKLRTRLPLWLDSSSGETWHAFLSLAWRSSARWPGASRPTSTTAIRAGQATSSFGCSAASRAWLPPA